MGTTVHGQAHYWTLRMPRSHPSYAKRLEGLAEDFAKAVPHLPPLASPDGRFLPVVLPSGLAFNGRSPADADAFLFPPKPSDWDASFGGYFGFCHTRGRPYDRAVQVALLLAKIHFGEALEILSDLPMAGWVGAALLVEKHLYYPADLYWALDKRLWLLRDSLGAEFYYEASRAEGKSEILHSIEALALRAGPRWPFKGPYALVGEERMDPLELARAQVVGVTYWK